LTLYLRIRELTTSGGICAVGARNFHMGEERSGEHSEQIDASCSHS